MTLTMSMKNQIITQFRGQSSPLRFRLAAITSGILSSHLIAGMLTMLAPLYSLKSKPTFFKPLKAKSFLGLKRKV